MRRVVLNGEDVEFEGEAPGSCKEACTLVEGYLSGQGLSLESVAVDGVAMSLEEAMEIADYSVLEFKSMSALAQLLNMCGAWRDETSKLLEEMRGLGAMVLRSGWSDSQVAVVEFLEKMRPVIEGIGVLQNFGNESGAPWAARVTAAFQAGLASIDGVANSIESRDSVRLSDFVASSLYESWREVVLCLEEDVIPVLEKEGAA
ncbi:hypothetical protein [Pelagicoccus mobilis]|uniref:Uncharacterized protein n=1 Tax=Pelagicoccus mobilis TaxID=415221 RepID=A0A934RSV5_9BACT|nr:hypothetical protein [Pelagicoccus mobilis]MBK1875756.1 hypothetical protein [Pelagicoccus mobilis]